MNKKNHHPLDSWYHNRWFRILLFFIALDIVILGGGFALGINVLIFFEGIGGGLVRMIIGLLYMVFGITIMHAVISYPRFKNHLSDHDSKDKPAVKAEEVAKEE